MSTPANKIPFFKSSTNASHCETFDDLVKKVNENKNLTDGDVDNCNVTAPDMSKTFNIGNNNNERDLLTLAISKCNYNNVKKLSKIIPLKNINSVILFSSLFARDNEAADSAQVFKITQFLMKNGKRYDASKTVFEALHKIPAFKDAIEYIIKEKDMNLEQSASAASSVKPK